MKQYFIHNGQNEQGPLDIEQLKLQPLKQDTPIWHEGLKHWTTASEIEEIKFIFTTKTSPPPFVKSTPPKYQETSSISSNIDTLELPKKKSILFSIIIGCVIIIGGIIGLNAYQKSVTVDTFVAMQQNEDASKEFERQRINIANTEKNKKYRNNWSDYISSTSNRYSYREIGGIFELEVIITNNTEYMLDEVDVQVGYIKDNGSYFKTEIVRVYNINAHSAKSQKAPESERGKSVDMTINGITSRKMHFCYQQGSGGNNLEDPYFCK